jgi:hypothetical protein
MRRTFWVLAALVLAVLLLSTGTAEAGNSITAPEMGADVGQHTSMVLDGSGYPVISHYDATNGDLKVMHCGNANCTSGNTITSPDTADDVGKYTSLALDSNGYPVVSYYDVTHKDLKVLHCGNATCTSGNTITSPDTGGDVGQYTSLALNDDRPVVSYYDVTNTNLKVLRCNDPNCAPGGDTITPADTAGVVGQYTSLRLDASGYPVVSYYDATNGDLKVLHCHTQVCDAGDTVPESIQSPDTAGNVGAYTSLALDGSGYPVVSYYHVSLGELRVLHCGNANCTSGNSIASPDTAGAVGAHTSLRLDGAGKPVVSYYDLDNGDLKVLHCGNTDCTASNTITAADTVGAVGQYTSLALAGTIPVVSYYDLDHGTLKLLRCGDANCTASNTIVPADTGGSGGTSSSLALYGGNPVIAYQGANGGLKVLHCGNANCTSGNSIASPDTVGAPSSRSLALDASGRPVVAYYDGTDLKVLHCGNANCTAGNSITVPDPDPQVVGSNPSLALDGNGYPVVSYYAPLAETMKVMHCNDVNCDPTVNGAESITTPDLAGHCGSSNSLRLDASGNPVVSYYGAHLKVLHCGNANCTSGNSITSPDTGDVGSYTSLALDASGYPVVSYYDYQPSPSHQNLKVMHCNDVNCAGSDETIAVPDTTGDVGQYTSLRMDAGGNPVVSYYDATNKDLKVLRCGNADCTSGNSITAPDTVGDVGWPTSLALDGGGKPVVSYSDNTNKDLKVLHCDTQNCTVPAYPPAGTDVLSVSLSFEHVYLCAEPAPGCHDEGAATFSGTGTFVRGVTYLSGGYNTIDTEVLSMVLTGTVYGDQVTIKAGTQQGLSASTGKIREQTPGTFYPADTWFDLFFKVESSDSNYDDTQNCDFGAGAQAVHFTGVTMSVPATYVEYHVPSCPLEPPPAADCVPGCGESGMLAASEVTDQMTDMRWYSAGGSGIGLRMSVGGIAEWPGTAAGPDSLADSSASSGFNYTALVAALGAAAVALAAGAWFVRRRWAR